MVEAIPRCMPAAVIGKLNALAEKRCAYFSELQRSGRWALFYSEEQFAACVREVTALAEISRAMLAVARADGSADPPPGALVSVAAE